MKAFSRMLVVSLLLLFAVAGRCYDFEATKLALERKLSHSQNNCENLEREFASVNLRIKSALKEEQELKTFSSATFRRLHKLNFTTMKNLDVESYRLAVKITANSQGFRSEIDAMERKLETVSLRLSEAKAEHRAHNNELSSLKLQIKNALSKEAAQLNLRKATLAQMSEKLVKQQLKAPKSAEFPPSDSNDVKIAGVAEDTGYYYYVVSWVDSQNSFGVLLRARTVVKMKALGLNAEPVHLDSEYNVFIGDDADAVINAFDH